MRSDETCKSIKEQHQQIDNAYQELMSKSEREKALFEGKIQFLEQ